MGNTIIRVGCIDQRLALITDPGIASGGRNEDVIEFDFCSLWDGFTKTVVFYRTEDEVYHAQISGNQCIIPHEVLAVEGVMYFGVFGVKGTITRTTEVLGYKVLKGALTEASKPTDPTPDIYTQILAQVGAIENRAAALEALLTQSEPYTITGGFVQLENIEGMPMECTADTAVALTRCGKNLLDLTAKPASLSNAVNTAIDGGVRITPNKSANTHFYVRWYTIPVESADMVGKTITLSCDAAAGGGSTPRLFLSVYNSSGSNIGTSKTKDGTGRIGVVYTIAQSDVGTGNRLAVGLYANTPGSETTTEMHSDYTNIQLEIGAASDFEPYQADRFTLTPGEAVSIPALAGVNTLYPDGGALTVSGKKDVFTLTSSLVKRIKALEETVATLSAAAVED